MTAGLCLMDAPTIDHTAEPSYADAEPATQSRMAKTRRWTWRIVRIPFFAYLGVVAVLFFWGALPAHSLASDIVTHVMSEPTDVSPSTLAVVLERTRLQLDSLPGEVVFAETCFFRGRLVPHLIVRTTEGPVTVMILPEERVGAPEHFDEGGYRGVVIPDNDHGSIAVLSRAQLDADRPAREILNALHVKSQT